MPIRPASTVLIALLVVMQIMAHAMASHPPEEQLVFVVDVENDAFARTDRYYTSGLRLTWVRPADHEPEWVHRLARGTPLLSDEARLGLTTAIGQSIYTPADKDATPPDPDDRPYAGWLYVTIGVDALTQARLDRLQLTLGVVGPASLGERSQRLIHDIKGEDAPQGWSDQLRNEPTLMLSYERQWHALASRPDRGWEADLTPHAGASLGTPFTFANGGFMIRAGRDLPMDYGPPRIQPGLPGSGLFESRPGRWGYGFAGVDVRLVGYDLLLDGNTWRDSPSVDKERMVGDLYLGLALGFEHLRVSYTHVWRTREFRTQDQRQTFGSLSVSWIH
ncbi:hypothetical protein B1C78_13900 [Thioalkalivibrio denitrificans]|uniref:Lipid A deacylase LpxR family protein n=2 Tax=Thioalkalivibrio denitrificans TaxID=108003 RepID=A0A1V3NDA4_9GAMM|nr:lipid A deacylase LpxR family protein [Thioalkalivibrio denitrificans]OOG22766.1 hypothetical protein B1C78_13900 [Thioalkalivibrio denitrificans]